HSLDERCPRQQIATSGTFLHTDFFEQQPGHGIRSDEGGIERGLRGRKDSGPHSTRVPSLPRSANRPVGNYSWISIGIARVRVRAEEVGDRLLVRLVEQSGLGREEHPGEAVTRGRARVVLRTGGSSLEKYKVALRHF